MPTVTRTRKMIQPPPAAQTGGDWRGLTLCSEVDPAIFYPEPGESWAAAKQVCSGCEVRRQCLQHALDTREAHGVWGGTTPRERSRLLAGAGQHRLTRSAPRRQQRSECRHGHLLDGENLRIRPDGGRVCRPCAREYKLARRGV